MKPQMYYYFNNCGPPPLISNNSYQMIKKTPTDKENNLKVEINTQTGEEYSETVAIYAPLFGTRSPEALLKLVNILNKTTNLQYLSMGYHKYGMTQ